MPKAKKKGKLTIRRSDLEAMGKDRLVAFSWIRAHTSLVHTKKMNMVLTANPITVITRLIPDDIIVPNFLCKNTQKSKTLQKEKKTNFLLLKKKKKYQQFSVSHFTVFLGFLNPTNQNANENKTKHLVIWYAARCSRRAEAGYALDDCHLSWKGQRGFFFFFFIIIIFILYFLLWFIQKNCIAFSMRVGEEGRDCFIVEEGRKTNPEKVEAMEGLGSEAPFVFL